MSINRYEPDSPKIFQILNAEGELVGEEPNIDEELLKEMYWWMLYARMADDKALKLQRQGRMGTFAPIKGQEAAQIGASMALKDEDWFVPAFREMGAFIQRGVPLEQHYKYFMGDVRGNRVPEDVNNLPIAVPVSTQIPHAVGLSWGIKLDGGNAAVLCMFGDGATSKGDFNEGLNFAGVLNVPIVLLCQNNQWAISLPIEKQTAAKTIAQKANAYGFPGIYVDGNDILAVYGATKEALSRARKGEGPTLIEALTYRLSMHTTADDPTKYRTEEELKKWEDREPLKRFRAYLQDKGIWSENWEKELENRANEKIDEAVQAAESIEDPKPEEMFEYMLGELPDDLLSQMEYLKKSLKEKEIEEEKVEIKGGFP
ncbi:MAG: pyruvate dehydrogenase (acetyl-transferring) E1 component subunit alpha [Candidatus Natronoplasma sp.]